MDGDGARRDLGGDGIEQKRHVPIDDGHELLRLAG